MQPPPATGQIQDLPLALREYLRNYYPGGKGLDAINGCFIAFPVPAWAEASVYDSASMASMGAGASTNIEFLTVPQNQRWWLDGLRITRASGDNTVNQIQVNYPAGYTNNATGMPLIAWSTASAQFFWPDLGQQANIQYMAGGPLLLEPGSKLQINPAGAGVAATVFAYHLQYRRMLLTRAQTADLTV